MALLILFLMWKINCAVQNLNLKKKKSFALLKKKLAYINSLHFYAKKRNEK